MHKYMHIQVTAHTLVNKKNMRLQQKVMRTCSIVYPCVVQVRHPELRKKERERKNKENEWRKWRPTRQAFGAREKKHTMYNAHNKKTHHVQRTQ